MLVAYSGLQGQGKSFISIVYGIFPLLEQGYKCYSNTWINFGNNQINYYHTLDEISHLRGTKENPIIVYIDEMGVPLNSRNWANLSEDVQDMFINHRKRYLILAGTVQDVDMVDIFVRRFIGRWVNCINYTPTESILGQPVFTKNLPFLLLREEILDPCTLR